MEYVVCVCSYEIQEVSKTGRILEFYNIQTMTQCIICYERCRKPVSCCMCRQILCSQHVKYLRSRCPNCRSQPFQLKRQHSLDLLIEAQIARERQQQKKTKIYKCLGINCQFEGNYQIMLSHQQQNHPEQNIMQLIYEEQRQKKIQQQALKQLIHFQLQSITERHNQLAFFIYIRNFGQCNLYTLLKMVQHLDKCQNPFCKKIFVQDDRVFIGDPQKKPTQCDRAKLLSSW